MEVAEKLLNAGGTVEERRFSAGKSGVNDSSPGGVCVVTSWYAKTRNEAALHSRDAAQE
jgi:hypothetical protein